MFYRFSVVRRLAGLPLCLVLALASLSVFGAGPLSPGVAYAALEGTGITVGTTLSLDSLVQNEMTERLMQQVHESNAAHSLLIEQAEVPSAPVLVEPALPGANAPQGVSAVAVPDSGVANENSGTNTEEESVSAEESSLITNGDFENGENGIPVGWQQGEWGSLEATYLYPAVGTSGAGAEVTVRSYQSGDAKWFHDEVAVNAGERYTYRSQYKASVSTSLVLQYRDGSNGYSYVWLKDVAAATTFSPVDVTFTVPSGVVGVTVFQVLAANGTLTIDDVSLLPAAPVVRGTPLVSVTFDDGWTSQYDYALPILSAHGVKGTFYIITDTLVPGRYTGYMSRAQVKALYAAGHQIGSHTITHADLATASARERDRQLRVSKSTLDRLLNTSVTSLAYPYGSYSPAVMAAAKKLGYLSARTVNESTNVMGVDPYEIASYSPTNLTPLSELTAAVDEAKRDGTWLVIAFHEFGIDGREYSNTPEYLDAFLSYVKSAGVEMVTIDEGIRRTRSQ